MNKSGKRTIYFIIHSMSGGGAEKVVSIILNHIDRNKFIPTLILFKKIGEYLNDIPHDINIIDLGKKNKWDFFKLIFKMRQIIKINKPDIVVSFLDYTNIVVMLAVFYLKTQPRIIISERSYHRRYLPHTRLKKLRKILMRFTYNKAHKIVAISNGIAVALTEDFKIEKTKIEVIYNPIDIKKIQILKEEDVSHKFFDNKTYPVLISVGRLTKSKNFSVLIKAFALAIKETPAYLIILGQGELKNDLQQLATQLGVIKYIDFAGFKKNPFSWMRKADLFVFSPTWEGFGNVIIEAMACGVAVISTDCPVGPREIITNNKNGILVPMNDEFLMSKTMLELIRKEELRNQIIEEAFRTVKRFDIKNILPLYEKVFEGDDV